MVVTLIRPELAPFGTTAISWPKETPVTLADATPLKRTTGVPSLRLAPVIVTLVLIGPVLGEKPEIVGGKLKLAAEVAEPAGVWTRIGPELEPAGTLTFRVVLLVAGPRVPETPLNNPSVAPKRLLPVSVTFVPRRPVVGEKLVNAGAT